MRRKCEALYPFRITDTIKKKISKHLVIRIALTLVTVDDGSGMFVNFSCLRSLTTILFW